MPVGGAQLAEAFRNHAGAHRGCQYEPKGRPCRAVWLSGKHGRLGFKPLNFHFRPIFMVAATHNSEHDPQASATKAYRKNPAKRSPDCYVHPYPVVETHGRPFHHALHFRSTRSTTSENAWGYHEISRAAEGKSRWPVNHAWSKVVLASNNRRRSRLAAFEMPTTPTRATLPGSLS